MELIILTICFGVGFLSSKTKILPSNSFKPINFFVLYLALPAISLKYVPNIKWENSLAFPLMMPIFVWFAGYLFLKILSFYVKISKPTFGALWLLIGLCNTSFMGFPLTTTYFGAKGLEIAILCDQMSFVIVSSMGLWVAIKYGNSNQEMSYKALIKKMISFPAFVCFVIALLLPDCIVSLNLLPILNPISSTLLPMAFLSIGLQIGSNPFQIISVKISILSLFFKLFLAPILIFCLGFFWVKPILNFQVTVLESAMAPMVTGVLISNQYNLNTKLSNSVLAIGIFLSLPSTYFWQYLLKLFAST